MRFIPLFFCFTFSLLLAFNPDTRLKLDTIPSFKAWTLIRGQGQQVRLDSRAAVRESEGLLILPGDKKELGHRTTYIPDFWQRCYLRFLCHEKATLSDTSRGMRIYFLSTNLSDRPQRESPFWPIRFFLKPIPLSDSSLQLHIEISPALDTLHFSTFKTTLQVNHEYCLESHIYFPKEDSLLFTVYLNGDSIFGLQTRYYHVNNFIELLSGNAIISRPNTEVHLAAWAYSKKRLPPTPPVPSSLSSQENAPFTVTLHCAPFHSNYRHEQHTATRWRLFLKSDKKHPLFESEEIDPKWLTERTIPFALDSGSYEWQVAFRNNHNVWSQWSLPASFSIDKERPIRIRMQTAYITEVGGQSALASLHPGNHYQVHFKLHPNLGWPDVAYIAAGLFGERYTLGHPFNTYGHYLKSSSYILNLSFEGMKADSADLYYYEKEENTILSGRVLKGDASRPPSYTTLPLIYDTLQGHIAIGFHLDSTADTGLWYLKSFACDSNGNHSNLFQTPFRVTRVHPKTHLIMWLLLGALFVLLLILLLYRLRPSQKSSYSPTALPPDPEFLRIQTFVEAHLAEAITTERIRLELHLSSHRFYQILKKNGIESLPKLLNTLRIQQAKKLLSETEKSIAEIGFEVGFVEARYFNKVFKDLTSQTPGEYRKNQK